MAHGSTSHVERYVPLDTLTVLIISASFAVAAFVIGCIWDDRRNAQKVSALERPRGEQFPSQSA